MIHHILSLSALIMAAATAFASPPSWWTSRNATNSNPASNQSLITTGQLKHLLQLAYDELTANLPNGPGAPLHAYLYGDTEDPSGVLDQNNTPYAPVLNGQLKHASSLFLDRLAEEGYYRTVSLGVTAYPWNDLTAGSPMFYQPVKIGEAKFLFAFDLNLDTDSDGSPDWLELKQMRDEGLTSHYFSDFSHASAYDQPLSGAELETLVAGYASPTGGTPIFNRIVEAQVNDVAAHFNNSRSTPLASYGNFVYWIYTATDADPVAPAFFMKLQQIDTSAGSTPHPQSSYSFVNAPGTVGHELMVKDGYNTPAGYPDGADFSHSAPSVGVDRDGHIHVTGSMHHDNWEYCVSTNPNDISAFERIENPDPRALPYDAISYPRFFNDETGRLFLTFRTKSSNYWFNGTTSAAIVAYDETSQSWSLLGDDEYLIADLLHQDLEPLDKNPATSVWDLIVHPDWASEDRPNSRKSVFYSTEGTYHRFFRVPETGARTGGHRTPNYGYQAYWQDVKFSPDGRMHICCAIRRAPAYDPNDPNADPAATVTDEVDGSVFWTYDQKTYLMNFDFGTDILYAYSDDGGQTFYTPDGAPADMPLRSTPLDDLSDSPLPPSATLANGGVAVSRDNPLGGRIYPRVALSLLPDGSPMIQYIINEFDASTFDNTGNYSMNAVRWDGTSWVEVSPDRWNQGSAGGIVSDANGGLWAFESGNVDENTVPPKPTSNGTTILYSANGTAGPWHEVASGWRNGIRHDIRAASFEGIIRYVDMDIQQDNTAELIRISVE